MKKTEMSEANTSQLIRLKAGSLGCILLRNNVGAYKDNYGNFVRYGLGTGSSDLIGIYKGIFIACEVKKKGKKPTETQKKFLLMVLKNGGIGFVCDDPDDFERLLNSDKKTLESYLTTK